jgi:periplasmic protein TonB
MFNELPVSGGRTAQTSKPWSVALSVVLQASIIGVLILIPLIYTQALPKTTLSTLLVAPPPPAPPPPAQAVVKRLKLSQVVTTRGAVAPTVIPKNVAIVKDQAPDVSANSQDTGVPGGTGNVLGAIGNGPAMPPPPKAPVPQRITVGGNVEAARITSKVQPEYPEVAKAAHVTGTVVLHAVISKDGSIQQLQLVSGPPLLAQAAMSAVTQWRYRPTSLNGQPVEVDTTIDVVFSLG